MKKLIGMLIVVGVLCVMLVIPAAAQGPVAVSGISPPGKPTFEAWRPIGKGEDDHYCLITVEGSRTFSGSIEGNMDQHVEILKRGTCESGPATFPSVQRGWGTFTGKIWDGKDMRGEGTCKTTFHGGWYWMDEDSSKLAFEGRLTLHACTGGLAGAHANLEIEFIPPAWPPTYSGRAFFSKAP